MCNMCHLGKEHPTKTRITEVLRQEPAWHFRGRIWWLLCLKESECRRVEWRSRREPVVVQSLSCLQLCGSMDCSMPGFPVLHCLPAFAQKSCPLSRCCHLTTSSSVTPFSSCPQSFPASGSFPTSQLFASSVQSIGALASVLPMNIQD